MAERDNIYKENISGAFFVDLNCIACNSCTQMASPFFTFNDAHTHVFVQKQPQHQHEKDKCLSALKACPVSSIGYRKDHDTYSH